MMTPVVYLFAAATLAVSGCTTLAATSDPARAVTRTTVEVVIDDFVPVRVGSTVTGQVDVAVDVTPSGSIAPTVAEGRVRLERHAACLPLACDGESSGTREDYPTGTVLTTCPPDRSCDDAWEFVTQEPATIPTGPSPTCGTWLPFANCRASNEVTVIASRSGTPPTLRLWLASVQDGPSITWLGGRGGTDRSAAVTAADLEAVDMLLRDAALERLHAMMHQSLAGEPEPGLPHLTVGAGLTSRQCGAWSLSCPEGAEANRISATWSGTVTGWWIDPVASRQSALERLKAEAGSDAVVDESTLTWEVVPGSNASRSNPRIRARVLASVPCPPSSAGACPST